MLKAQDLLIALKLVALQADQNLRSQAVEKRIAQLQDSDLSDLDQAIREIDLNPLSEWTYRSVSAATRISASEVNAAIQRAILSGLLVKPDANSRPRPIKTSLLEFVEHGVRYAYPAERGEPARGIPTAFAAPLFDDVLASEGELPPVWPYAHGSVLGYTLSPIYKTAPFAAATDPILYELLVLVDVFRIGRQREKSIAHRMLRERLA
jgi:hypothetical protein